MEEYVALLAYPCGHTLSPAMHRVAFAALNLNWNYLAFEVKEADLERAISGLDALGFVGANLSLPHKENALKFLTYVAEEAKDIGAVNTLVRRENGFAGYNTDMQGFLASLRFDAAFDPSAKKVLLLGAGGAARAIAYGLAKSEVASLTIVNRSYAKAEKIKEMITQKFPEVEVNIFTPSNPRLKQEVLKNELIVQATSVGLKKEEDFPLISPDWLNSDQLVYEIIYNPYPTPFARRALKKGCKVVNGLGMLLYQGAYAFELWTGMKPPLEIMRLALEIAMKGR